jgi:hypothetical protein
MGGNEMRKTGNEEWWKKIGVFLSGVYHRERESERKIR